MTFYFTVFGALQCEKADEVANNTLEGGYGAEERSAKLYQLPLPTEKTLSQAWPISLFYRYISSQKDLCQVGKNIFSWSPWVTYTQR